MPFLYFNAIVGYLTHPITRLHLVPEPNIDAIISLLIQLPVIGIFIWYNERRDSRQTAREDKRDEANVKEREFRDKEWREYLREQREQNNAALGRLADELKVIAEKVAQLHGILSAHDAASKERALLSQQSQNHKDR